MKRLLAGVVAITLVLGGNVVLPNMINNYNFSLAASAEESGSFKYAVTNDGDAVLTGYTGSETDVTLPEIFDGHTVTGISYEFSLSNDGNNAVRIKRLVLPDSIKNITDCAPGANMADLEEIVLNEGLEEFDPLFLQYSRVSDLTIPSTCKIASGTDIFTLSDLNLKSITIAEGNPYYKSVDGIVYSADMKIAEYCPFLYEKTSVTIPDGCEEIAYGTFFGDAIKEITIPDSVTKIGEYAVGYHSTDGKDIGGAEHAAPQSPDTYQFVAVPDFKIKCHRGSAAEQYAKDNGIDYELIDNAAGEEYADILYDDNVGRWYILSNEGNKCVLDCVYDDGWYTWINEKDKKIGTKESETTVSINGSAIRCTVTYTVLKDGTAMLISATEPNTVLSEIDGYKITAIAPWYDLPQMLNEINLPDTITYLGTNSFEIKPGVCRSIKLSKNLKCIEKGAMVTEPRLNDSTINRIDLPNGLKYVGPIAFLGFTSLKSISIPASVDHIGDYAFGYCWDTDIDDPIDYDNVNHYKKIDDFTIYGYKGTEAESYAIKNSFKFVALDADNSSDNNNNGSSSEQSSSVDNNSKSSSQSTNNSTAGKSSTASTNNPNTGVATAGFGLASIGGIALVVAKRKKK